MSAHAPSRTSGAFSPIPPVKITASRPFIAAANEPMYFLIWYWSISDVSFALSSPFSIAAVMSRLSLEIPETPRKPDFLFMYSLICEGVKPCLSATKVTADGSTEPVLVPITTPSRGVKPIEVSTDLPPLTAVMEEPLPRWHETILRSSTFLPIASARALETNLWDVPWKPYFLT